MRLGLILVIVIWWGWGGAVSTFVRFAKLRNQYFPKTNHKVKKSWWTKDLFNVGDRHMGFKVIEYEKIIDMFSDSISQQTLKKFPLKECWCSTTPPKKNPQLSEEATQITFSSPAAHPRKPVSSHVLCLAAQSCLSLWPHGPPGSAVHGVLPARTLQRVAMPLSRRSFWPRDRTQVSRMAGRFFTIWAPREAQEYWSG